MIQRCRAETEVALGHLVSAELVLVSLAQEARAAGLEGAAAGDSYNVCGGLTVDAWRRQSSEDRNWKEDRVLDKITDEKAERAGK